MQTEFKQQTQQLMKAVYRWQRDNQTRFVVRRSGKIRFIKDTDWERGVFWTCVATAWHATGDQEYLAGLMNYSLHTGFSTGPKPRFADDLVCSQAYLAIYPQINQAEALEPTINFIDHMLAEPKPGREDWWWCDALFMAAPAFAALAKQTGKQAYLDYMNEAWWNAIEHLQDPETGLIFRDKRYIPDGKGGELREQNGEKVFWSRGIGWVIAAIALLLQSMPQQFAHRPKYIALFKQLAAEIIKYQQQDGFWRASLLDPANFPAPESSATGLFCYALAWGVNQGLLERDIYQPHVEQAWQGLQTAVDSDGRLGWVQLPAFNPREVKFEHNIDYGAGALLLAGSEVQHLYD